MAPAEECLLCKHEVLNSKFGPTKKKEKEKKQRRRGCRRTGD
jgi:hypothetical protein